MAVEGAFTDNEVAVVDEPASGRNNRGGKRRVRDRGLGLELESGVGVGVGVGAVVGLISPGCDE